MRDTLLGAIPIHNQYYHAGNKCTDSIINKCMLEEYAG